MAKRTTARILSDAFMKTRAPTPKPARVSIIRNGVKYKAGQSPARVCPAGSPVRGTFAKRV